MISGEVKLRERMTIEQASVYLAEVERPAVVRVDIRSPFPSLKTEVHPMVKRWKNRIRQATQDGSLTYRRDPENNRGQALYTESDLKEWAERLFPRREARFV